MTDVSYPPLVTYGYESPQSGTVDVATAVGWPGTRRWECPAAPLLAGELRRRGVPIRTAPLELRGYSGGAGTAWVARVPRPGADATGLAAGTVRGDPVAMKAARAVRALAAVRQPRTVLLASPRSFCAGVERAIEVVERCLQRGDAPVHVRKQIVHNATVVADLERRGVVFVEELDEVPDGATVVFSAHGVSPEVHAEASRRGLDVIDAACPLVTKVHAEARRAAARGDTVVLIGHAGHEEVEGTTGVAPDSTVLVESVADVQRLRVPDPQRVTYLTQTTLAVDEAETVVAALRERYPLVAGPPGEDICYATTNRQQALAEVARDVDVMLVVGSRNSSNSVRLMELAERIGTTAHLIDDVTEVEAGWLTGATRVGLTAGASAPARLVDDAVTALAGLGPLEVVERAVTDEDVHFTLPRRVRTP